MEGFSGAEYSDPGSGSGGCGYQQFSSPAFDRQYEAERVLLDPHNPSSYANGNYKSVLAQGTLRDTVSDPANVIAG